MENELVKSSNQFKTKLEKALCPNENGMVSAKHLYEMLGLNPSNYSKWCKSNFFTDFGMIDGVEPSNYPFVPKDERTNTEVETAEVLLNQMKSELEQMGVGIQPNPSQDYLISIRIANRICLKSKSEHREEIMEYFLDLEESIGKSANALAEFQKKYEEKLLEYSNQLSNALSQIEDCKNQIKLIEKQSTDTAALAQTLESGAIFACSNDERWVTEQREHIEKLAKEMDLTQKECIEELIKALDESEKLNYSFQDYANAYRNNNPGCKVYRMAVLSSHEDLMAAFEEIVFEFMVKYKLATPNDKELLCKLSTFEPEYQTHQSREYTNEELETIWDAIDKMP